MMAQPAGGYLAVKVRASDGFRPLDLDGQVASCCQAQLDNPSSCWLPWVMLTDLR